MKTVLKLKPRFKSQWNVSHSLYHHIISDEDCAIPDLTFSIQELRDKFTLQTELIRQAQRKGSSNYVFKNLGDDDDEAFDSPAVEYSKGVDLVDIEADRMRLRAAVVSLKNARLAAKSDNSEKKSEKEVSSVKSDSDISE